MAETAKRLTTLQLGPDDDGLQIPVTLKKIQQKQDVSFDSASPGGNPIKQVNVDLHTAEPVARDEIQRGVFRAKPKKSDKATWDDFVAIDAEALLAIEETTALDNFVIDYFIPLRDLPKERIQDAYFLAPAEGMSAKPLVLLAKALRKTKRAGVFKLVKTSRQYLAVVYEKDGGLIVNTLAYSGDFAAVREAAEALDRQDGKVVARELDLAVALISGYAAEADVLDGYEDDLLPLRAALVERALKGEKITKPTRKAHTPVADDGLEAKLRASIAQVQQKVPVGS